MSLQCITCFRHQQYFFAFNIGIGFGYSRSTIFDNGLTQFKVERKCGSSVDDMPEYLGEIQQPKIPPQHNISASIVLSKETDVREDGSL